MEFVEHRWLPLAKENDTVTVTTEDNFHQKHKFNDLFEDAEKKMDMAVIMATQKLFQVMKNIIRKRFQWFIRAVYQNTRKPSMFNKIKNSIAETNSVNKKKLSYTEQIEDKDAQNNG
jgi:flagellar basal body P-ring protein FlgI